MATESTAAVFTHGPGLTPLVVSMPHVGTELPAALTPRLTAAGRAVADTDWHVDQLYGFASEMGAAWLRARYSRYLIDLNRPPDDRSLYPGQTTTSLCPDLTFEGEPIYLERGPDGAEIDERRERYWRPYHATLTALLEAAIERHGFAVLLDAHSIRSRVPRLFAGRLPDVNVGTNDGASCDRRLAEAVMAVLQGQATFSHVLNGRFKGGHITRAYGKPERRVHAVQLELAQAAYMDESGTAYEPERAKPLQAVLKPIVAALAAFRP